MFSLLHACGCVSIADESGRLTIDGVADTSSPSFHSFVRDNGISQYDLADILDGSLVLRGLQEAINRSRVPDGHNAALPQSKQNKKQKVSPEQNASTEKKDEFLLKCIALLGARLERASQMQEFSLNTEHHEEIAAVSHLYFNYTEYAASFNPHGNFFMSGNLACNFNTTFQSGPVVGVMNGKQPDAFLHLRHITHVSVGILNGEHKRSGAVNGRGQGLIMTYSNLKNLQHLHAWSSGDTAFPKPIAGFVYVEGITVEAYVLLDDTFQATRSCSSSSSAASSSSSSIAPATGQVSTHVVFACPHMCVYELLRHVLSYFVCTDGASQMC